MTVKHSDTIKIRINPVTKKQLCVALGLISRKGKCYYDKLRRDYLTDDLLIRAGFPPERYRNNSIFNIHVTKVLLTELEIEPSDIYP
mgnify:CR=1 FL=1